MKQIWRLYTYDLWGNPEDGFEVNDVFRSADTIELGEEWTETDLIGALTKEGYPWVGNVEVDPNVDNHGGTIYLISKEHGSPVCELRLED